MPLKNFDEIKIFQRKVAFLVLFGGIWIILGNFQGIIILRGGYSDVICSRYTVR